MGVINPGLSHGEFSPVWKEYPEPLGLRHTPTRPTRTPHLTPGQARPRRRDLDLPWVAPSPVPPFPPRQPTNRSTLLPPSSSRSISSPSFSTLTTPSLFIHHGRRRRSPRPRPRRRHCRLVLCRFRLCVPHPRPPARCRPKRVLLCSHTAITRQIEHKLLKRGFQFNVMVVGAYASGGGGGARGEEEGGGREGKTEDGLLTSQARPVLASRPSSTRSSRRTSSTRRAAPSRTLAHAPRPRSTLRARVSSEVAEVRRLGLGLAVRAFAPARCSL